MVQAHKIDLKNILNAYNDMYLLLSEQDKTAHRRFVNDHYECSSIGSFSFDDFEKIDTEANHPVACIKCGSDDVCKNGKDKNKRQRYICQMCGATFGLSNNSMVSNVKQDVGVWVKFIRGMLRLSTVEELSADCNISDFTAFSWKLRVFYALEILQKQIILSGTIIADDTKVPYNLKGNHGEDFCMPRKARKRGGANTVKNSHKNSVCVLCAIDDNGNAFSRIIGFGNPSGARISDGFKDKIEVSDNTTLVTDGAKCFGHAVNTYKIPRWERKVTQTKGKKRVPDTSSQYNVQKINTYHGKLQRFLRNYNGVSLRFLPGYLLLFDYLQNNRDVDMSYLCREILFTLAHTKSLTKRELENRYFVPVSNIPNEELWERRIPLKEQKIYKAWVNKMPIKEIEQTFKIKRRKIYDISKKVKKYGKHDEIVNKDFEEKADKKPISYRDWSIFSRVYCDNAKIKDVAREYELTTSAIYTILRKVKNTPEGAAIVNSDECISPLKRRGTFKSQKEEIYSIYKFLKNAHKEKKDIYEVIARKYHLNPNTLRGEIYELRKEDISETFRRNNSKGKWKLPPQEHYKHLQERNRTIVEELNVELRVCKNGAFKRIGEKHGVSRPMAIEIYNNQEKYLHVYDNYLKKHHDTTRQEQNQEWEAP